MNDDHPIQHDRDVESVERRIDLFDDVMTSIRDAFFARHNIPAEEQRWRWDVPVITFTWTKSDMLSRNLNGLVLGASVPTGIELEGNVWRDVVDGQTYRRWKHLTTPRIKVSRDAIEQSIERLYAELESCTSEDLGQGIRLP